MVKPSSLAVVGRAGRFLVDRGVWKEVNYAFAAITCICSCVFFVLGIRELIGTGASMTVTDDLLAAIWFLLQGPFLLSVTSTLDRRRNSASIRFPDRRA